VTESSLAPAALINLDAAGSEPIPCLFNPKEYTVGKQNQWTLGTKKGSNVPQFDFGGGQAATLQVQLFFDTYSGAKGNGPSGSQAEDVRERYTEKIWNLMLVDPHKKDHKNKAGRPPRVRFQWGRNWSFEAVIVSIKQHFTLFLADGTPVRATLDVNFQQIKDADDHPPQNPTSAGDGGERQWTVSAGDTLAGIAYSAYGDPNLWRRIADANGLFRVRRLQPGMVLGLPSA
jgi:hypothetical protein